MWPSNEQLDGKSNRVAKTARPRPAKALQHSYMSSEDFFICTSCFKRKHSSAPDVSKCDRIPGTLHKRFEHDNGHNLRFTTTTDGIPFVICKTCGYYASSKLGQPCPLQVKNHHALAGLKNSSCPSKMRIFFDQFQCGLNSLSDH